ncbi:putative Zn-finger containing protein [Halorhabdus sp. SVX81]|uniref:Sjogren's syndrome/scleroderma autoantigen 1 family protein n=1 Tax=Halorhabdus sp. SVX81 TaxID=2978283 RepID=UPI0023D9FE88|nr:Sjogren's syndrome/scleroderma autoantigen 1 family protein [Halorhabdus sp. SVX81]WEL16701.1 putative Zn-finger containing protein [Halorhabdus sp. SVX81]
MSDFDEEAERERLREQFEQDRKKREATEQMSELLLQGATMTDTHCERCGDPIFRYDGQEFCPTCQQSAGENAASESEATDGTAETQDTATNAGAQSGAQTGDTKPQSEPETVKASAQPPVESPTSPAHEEPPQPETPGHARGETGPQHDQRVDVPGLEPGASPQPTRDAGDLQDARDSLVATLSTFARQAEATDDPRRATDALEAAREAAEALAALDGTR